MRILLILVLAVCLSSCIVVRVGDHCESLRKGETRFTNPQPAPSLAQHCSQFLRKYSEDQWDADTETYPRNVAWRECMGVERKPVH